MCQFENNVNKQINWSTVQQKLLLFPTFKLMVEFHFEKYLILWGQPNFNKFKKKNLK